MSNIIERPKEKAPMSNIVERPYDSMSYRLDLKRMNDDEVAKELANQLGFTAAALLRTGACVVELESRGKDLSYLRYNLLPYVRMIGQGTLLADIVVTFMGKPNLIRCIASLPLEKQKAIYEGEKIPIINPNKPDEVLELPLTEIPNNGIHLVFGDGEIRNIEAQRLYHRPLKKEAKKPRFKPRYNKEEGTLKVGQTVFSHADLLNELSTSAGVDKLVVDNPEDWVNVNTKLTTAEQETFLAKCKKMGLPEWEVIRKCMRAFGVI